MRHCNLRILKSSTSLIFINYLIFIMFKKYYCLTFYVAVKKYSICKMQIYSHFALKKQLLLSINTRQGFFFNLHLTVKNQQRIA